MNDKTPIIQFKDLLEQHKATVYEMANEIRSIDPSRPVIPAISNNPPTVYDLVATVFAAGYAAGVENGRQHHVVDAYAHLTICIRCGQIHDSRVDCHTVIHGLRTIEEAAQSIDRTAVCCPRCGIDHRLHQAIANPAKIPEPERDDPHEDLGYKGRGR